MLNLITCLQTHPPTVSQASGQHGILPNQRATFHTKVPISTVLLLPSIPCSRETSMLDLFVGVFILLHAVFWPTERSYLFKKGPLGTPRTHVSTCYRQMVCMQPFNGKPGHLATHVLPQWHSNIPAFQQTNSLYRESAEPMQKAVGTQSIKSLWECQALPLAPKGQNILEGANVSLNLDHNTELK